MQPRQPFDSRQPFDVGQKIKKKRPHPGDRQPTNVTFGGWDEDGKPFANYVYVQRFPIEDLNDWEPVTERPGQGGLMWE